MTCLRNSGEGKRRGSVAVLVGVCLVGLLGVVAIAADGGLLLEKRRHAQATADATALAAADVLFQNYPLYAGLDTGGAARTQALATAAANGYSNDGNSSLVTVRFSPELYQDGPNKGSPLPRGYVEVVVEYRQPRGFSRVFSSDTIPVRARAVARGMWEPIRDGVIVLDLAQRGALNAHGNGKMTVTAPISVNSNHAEAALVTGQGTLSATQFLVTGGTGTSGGGGSFSGPIQTGVPPVADPLRHLPPPDASTLTVQSSSRLNIKNGDVVLYPGVYRNGIEISGNARVTMQPGVYYIDGGGFSFKGQGSLTGRGVMIYNKPVNGTQAEGITGTGGGIVTLTPPASGIYKGLAFFQERGANVDAIFAGNGSFNISGTFYAPNALLRVAGEGDMRIGSQLISRAVDLGGNGDLNVPYDPATVAPTRIVGLVD
jgi:hypothetical protein